MKVKKKYISWSKRLFITSVILSIVVVSGLQGSCASPTKNYIKYDNFKVSSYVWNGGTTQFNNDLVLDSVDIWYNYFYPVSAYPYETTSYYTLRIVFKDFFTGLSYDSSYHYHLTFGFTGGSTVYSKFNSSGTAFVFNSSFTTSKSSVSNGDTRFIFDFDISGMSGNSDLVLSFSTKVSSATFLCSSWGEASYYTVVTGSDKIINQFGSNYSQPNTDNQDNYNNAESQLIGGVQSTLNGVNSQWNNLNGNLLEYQGAFMAFNRFFNNLTGIPWVGTVITLSVAIGVFALLLGSAFIYANRKGK